MSEKVGAEAFAVPRHTVVADAGPLIALAGIDSLALLQALFGRVVISATVRDEVLPAGSTFPDAETLKRALAQGWLEVADGRPDDWQPLNPGIDPGEASAIRLARRALHAGADLPLLLMDDRAGRMEARHHGLALIGTAAVIGMARIERLIPAARPLLERLTQSGYFLGQTVIDAVLAEVGEP